MPDHIGESVTVDLGDRSYQIAIESGALSNIGQLFETASLKPNHVIAISDTNVSAHYLKTVTDQLSTFLERVDSIVVQAGETSKSVATCDSLWQQLDRIGTDRSSIIVALGGGVVGDLAGFVAASYSRGLPFVQIPTSLLAQVDSSVGGKTGINLPTSKNMVGAFWQPQLVIIDPDVLTTLDEPNFIAGMAEVIKYGLIMDAPLFEFLRDNAAGLKNRDAALLTKVIAWCCRCKAAVVKEDETETTGRRAILNYGHTYGHAIESVFGYGKYLHGQAIAIGMVCAARLAKSLAMVDQEFCDQQRELLEAFGLPTDCPGESHDDLLAAMTRDKKSIGGKLKLILPTRIGHVELVDAPPEDVIRASLQNES